MKYWWHIIKASLTLLSSLSRGVHSPILHNIATLVIEKIINQDIMIEIDQAEREGISFPKKASEVCHIDDDNDE